MVVDNIISAVANRTRVIANHLLMCGFTLLELLFVTLIVSIFILMGTRYLQQQTFDKKIEQTAAQMQQILNASLAYYVANGQWPRDFNDLVEGDYFPEAITSPWFGTAYRIAPGTSTSVPNLYLWLPLTKNDADVIKVTTIAKLIAGYLPAAYTTNFSDADALPTDRSDCSDTSSCTVVTTLPPPGQNLNNASAVNFANVYHHGACVPVPTCPVDPKTGTTMTPQIMVVPVAMRGAFDSGQPNKVYPISGFAAYAKGPTDYTTNYEGPEQCDSDNTGPRSCLAARFSGGRVEYLPRNKAYWRVCLQVTTSKGDVAWDTSATEKSGEYATILALTRCAIANEPSGSNFTVWTK